jgi:methylmalonyl-CoA mutase N-terminal domain/subunit
MMEELTRQLVSSAMIIIDEVESMGGMAKAIESGNVFAADHIIAHHHSSLSSLIIVHRTIIVCVAR